MSTAGKFITHNVLWFLEKLHLVPQGTFAVCETLKEAAVALVKGGRTKVRPSRCTIFQSGANFL